VHLREGGGEGRHAGGDAHRHGHDLVEQQRRRGDETGLGAEILAGDAPNLPRRLTFDIPLVEFTAVNGAMEVIPGSHHMPRNAHS